MDNNYEHLVEYENYCKNCEHKDCLDFVDPCDHCLSNPVNTNTKKPVDFAPTKEYLKKEKIEKERKRLASKSRLQNKTVK